MKRVLFTSLVVCGLIGGLSAQELVASNETAPTDLAYKVVNGEVKTETHVTFAKGTAEIMASSEQELKTIKKYLEDKSYISLLRVEGHTSCNDNAQNLSEERALAVCKWLTDHGIDCKRLLAVGFGCGKPIADSHNEANERITFVNAALKGKPIGGMPVDGGGKVAGEVCR